MIPVLALGMLIGFMAGIGVAIWVTLLELSRAK